MEEQYAAMKSSEKVAREREEEKGRVKMKLKEARDKEEFERGMDGWFERWKSQSRKGLDPENEHHNERASQPTNGKLRAMCSEALSSSSSTNLDTSTALDAVIAPLGGGGLLGGIATYFSRPPSTGSTSQQRKTFVFGAEPQFQGANDAELGLKAGKRVEHVSTLTIADGLRTPVGELNWEIISDPDKVEGVYSVTEEQIKQAMRLVFERMKLVVEPSGCVGLAVVLYNEPFRKLVAEKQRVEGRECWDVGIVFSGGNTTMEAIVALYSEEERPRDEGTVGMDGKKEAEDVAG
jgi:threonine dehydratase